MTYITLRLSQKFGLVFFLKKFIVKGRYLIFNMIKLRLEKNIFYLFSFSEIPMYSCNIETNKTKNGNVKDIRVQFQQCSTSSFYARRSQKCKKAA